MTQWISSYEQTGFMLNTMTLHKYIFDSQEIVIDYLIFKPKNIFLNVDFHKIPHSNLLFKIREL